MNLYKYRHAYERIHHTKLDLTLPKGYERYVLVMPCEQMYEGKAPIRANSTNSSQ